MIPTVKQTVKNTKPILISGACCRRHPHATRGSLNPGVYVRIKPHRSPQNLERVLKSEYGVQSCCTAFFGIYQHAQSQHAILIKIVESALSLSHQFPSKSTSTSYSKQDSFSNPPRFLNQVKPTVNRQPLQTWFVLLDF